MKNYSRWTLCFTIGDVLPDDQFKWGSEAEDKCRALAPAALLAEPSVLFPLALRDYCLEQGASL